jgi:uroporphyrinogen-III decarboxylase
MRNRERIERTLHRQPVDRFPVWLKMTNRTWQNAQPEPYRSMGAVELLRAANCDVMIGCGLPGKAFTARRPHVTCRTENEPGLRRTLIETPDGTLVGEESLDPFTQSWHPTKFCAVTTDEFRALRWFYTDTEYAVDADLAQPGHERQRQLEEQDIYTTSGVGPGPLMNLIEHMCGPEHCVFHVFDTPELFADVLETMHQDRLRYLRAVLPHTPADTFWLTENTSTSLISPDMFRRFCQPHLAAYGQLVLDNGIVPVHHMCGTLNALLEDIDSLPALVNEAYTTRPLGDVSLAEGRKRMPSKALIGGTNATLWLEPVETIVRTVVDDLRECPDVLGIFLTSAGVLPAPVSFEKARAVATAFQTLNPADLEEKRSDGIRE